MDKSNSGALAALKETWNNLSSTQKLVVSSVVAISIIIVVVVSTVGMRPSMDTLFSNLQSADAAAIADRLRDLKVPYDLSADGAVIKVPSNQVYDLRLKMTSQGLPAGGTVGFEVFNKTNFGMSEFNQKVTYLQALQGELKRTICQLEQVDDARVMLTQPEDRLYTDKQEDAKAAVTLKLKRGTALGDDQVAGIVRLVASSVEGLKPENVTVTDTNANMLSEATGDSGGLSARLTATQVRLKREYEQQLQKDVQSMLDNITGPGKSVVRVSAKMNFDHKETTTELVTPGDKTAGKGILVSEDTVSESYNGAGGKAGGPVSVTQVAPKPAVPANSDYTHTETSNKYEVTRSTEKTISSPGQVTKLSVAVMLDQAVGASKIPSIRDAVKAAVGIDETKGDVIMVSSVAFDRSDQKKELTEMAAANKSEMTKTLIKDGAAVVLLIVFVLFVRSLFKSIKFQPSAAGPAGARPTMESAGEVVNKAYEGAPAQPAERMPSGPSGSETYAQELVKSNPDEVANVVKAWMSEKN